MESFLNRVEAGKILSEQLLEFAGDSSLVLGIPRGGVVVADQIAQKLGCPLDVITPRKIGAPFQAEYAIGAVCCWGPEVFINEQAVRTLNIPRYYIESEIDRQMEEAKRRLLLYRNSIEPPEVRNKTVIITDDGIATGYTARAALASIRKLQPNQLILAAPVGAIDSVQELRPWADKIVCPMQPTAFCAVGAWYVQFDQTTDAEVIDIIKKYRQPK